MILRHAIAVLFAGTNIRQELKLDMDVEDDHVCRAVVYYIVRFGEKHVSVPRATVHILAVFS